MFSSNEPEQKEENGVKEDLCSAGEKVLHGAGDVFHKIGDYLHPKPEPEPEPSWTEKVVDEIQEILT